VKISVDAVLLVPVHSVIEVRWNGQEELENVTKDFRTNSKSENLHVLEEFGLLVACDDQEQSRMVTGLFVDHCPYGYT